MTVIFYLTRAFGSEGDYRIDSGPSVAVSASVSSASATLSNDISSEAAVPMATKLQVEPPGVGGQKFVCKVWVT